MGYGRYYCSVTGVLLLPETPCQIAGFFVTMGLPRQQLWLASIHPRLQHGLAVF